jgi:hypothetical protein
MPNLFIVGAPKCGTTALSSYLAGHPMIFMSEQAGVKEPFFFCSDAKIPIGHLAAQTQSPETYYALFREAGENVSYLGEATVSYLYSRVAIPAILRISPAARLVVMLRNPLEIAEALHNEFAKHGHEIKSFESAWRLQDVRMQGRNLPYPFETADLLQYGPIAKLGEQVQRLLAVANRDQIYIEFYEDFAEDPARTYRALLQWLDLPDDDRSEFPRVNSRSHRHFPRLEKRLQRLRELRHKLGIAGRLGIHALIERFNRTERKPLRPAFERQLKAYFREDVALLSELVGRDLTYWTAES